MNENNQDNILSSEKKMNLAPVSSDMVELSEQRAAELAKPFEREEPETKPAEATVETTIETTEEQLQAYADPLANFNPETIAEPVQQAAPELHPIQTKPTFSAPQTQEVKVVQVIEDKSIQLKEKWSIALGFGAIPLGFTTVLLSVYLSVMAMTAALGSAAGAATVAQVIYWITFAAIIATPIVGFILGNKYEKATGKISTGKIMSIVSGIVVGVIVALSIFSFVQQQIQKAEYEKKYNNYTNSSSLYR